MLALGDLEPLASRGGARVRRVQGGELFRKEAVIGCSPRTHVLLRFDEADVRTTIGEVIAHDDA